MTGIKPKLIILKGLPGSGKTTYALQQQKGNTKLVRINKDELRETLFGKRWDSDVKPHEWLIIKIRNDLISLALKSGYSVIVDDTNLNPFHIRQLTDLFGKMVTLQVVDFTNIPIETCIQRDKGREYAVGEKVIKDMYKKYINTK